MGVLYFRKLEGIGRKIQKTNGDGKIDLLSQQINEVSKILGVLVSME